MASQVGLKIIRRLWPYWKIQHIKSWPEIQHSLWNRELLLLGDVTKQLEPYGLRSPRLNGCPKIQGWSPPEAHHEHCGADPH